MSKITKPDDNHITVIDETLREGMQYRGIMFSLEQRVQILNFQETLGVDICQAGYPSAHKKEAKIVSHLCKHASDMTLKTRIAGMGRATPDDAALILKTGAKELHFHIHIKSQASRQMLEKTLADLTAMASMVKQKKPDTCISIALLDIGKSDMALVQTCVTALDHPDIDILSLPDTSGVMSPNQVFEKISDLCSHLCHTKISVHCHNDMGMANANSMMGIVAGGRVLEASALGIGERNGLADLYVTAKHLKDQGFKLNLNTDDVDAFKEYYDYVDHIVYEQTGHHLLTVNTPVFGDAVKTHVAGTHADGGFGTATEEKIFINALCGKQLVKKFLDHNGMDYTDRQLYPLTQRIKSESFKLNRSLTKKDIETLLASLKNK